MSFEKELDKIFEDAIDVLDIDMRYSEKQTLKEAIADLIEDEIQNAIDNYEYEPPERDEM